MKKILIFLCCVFSIFFISCASKQPAPDVQEETEAAENLETEEEDSEVELVSAEETVEVSEGIFPEPEDFEEPEIITLEPADIIEEVEEETEESANLEVVEQEEPPAITEEVTPAQETSVETTESLDITDNSDSDETSDNTDEIEDLTDSSGIIEISDVDSDSENEITAPEIEEIKVSRSVTLKKFENLEITYPGQGWIFMGLTDNSKDLVYHGRKLGTKDTKFTFQARNAGTKIAHFYKNDPLSGDYLDDYIEITILPENGSNKTSIAAPEYKLPVKKLETKKNSPAKTSDKEAESPAENTSTIKKQTESEAANQTSTPVVKKTSQATAALQTQEIEKESVETQTETSQPAQNNSNPDVLLKEAKVLYNEKEFSRALNKVNQFLEFAADNRDEGLYLKGQILEAKSEVRDIKGSMEAYTSLTKNYPASKLWDSANKRIIYLKRFYLEVR